MPDVWTKHPEVVRDLLKEAGFTCGVEGRFLKGRDPVWTCVFDGRTISGDLYIHHVDQLRTERPPDGAPAPLWASPGDIVDWSTLALAVLLGVVIARWWPGGATRP
jgi:hypothetical protein